MSLILLIIGSIIMGNSINAGVGWGCLFIGWAVLNSINPMKIEFGSYDGG